MRFLQQLLIRWRNVRTRSSGVRKRRLGDKGLRCESLESRRFLAADIFPVFVADAPVEAAQTEVAVSNAENCPYMQALQLEIETEVETVSADLFVAAGDFNADGLMDIVDLDSLTAAIATHSADMSFDLTSDNVVDHADLSNWLATSGELNLGSGRTYYAGDADLDGEVDVIDWHHMNWHLFTSSTAWSSGDFNADGVVDGSDVALWNINKYQEVSEERPVNQQTEEVVEEPTQFAAIQEDAGNTRKVRGKLAAASRELRM